MAKRRPALTAAQLAFSFAAPNAPTAPGDLAGLRKMIAASVARMLNEDTRGRPVIAATVSSLLTENVTLGMLDAYASEARTDHAISMHRWCAIVAVTRRYDVLDAILIQIGARALDGDEMVTAQLGHLYAQRGQIDDAIKALKPQARPFGRSRA